MIRTRNDKTLHFFPTTAAPYGVFPFYPIFVPFFPFVPVSPSPRSALHGDSLLSFLSLLSGFFPAAIVLQPLCVLSFLSTFLSSPYRPSAGKITCLFAVSCGISLSRLHIGWEHFLLKSSPLCFSRVSSLDIYGYS